jgi:radical SAM superfamily enzyme YgiQ (UPF0313 family)
MLIYLQNTFGINDVFFADDMFVFDRKNVLEFCKLLKQTKKLNITWSVFARVGSVDKELLSEMKKVGCWQIGYGLESGSEKVLNAINKKQTVEQMEKAIGWANEVGIVVRGLFMVGSFGETKDTLKETQEFIKRNLIKDFHITFFTPMPGTKSFDTWKEYGVWHADSDEGSSKSQHSVAFVPHGLTGEDLIYYQKRLYKTFLKPSVLFYHFKKLFNPSLTMFILKGGLSFIKYSLKKH